jgi:exosortase/archaeosortase family protein
MSVIQHQTFLKQQQGLYFCLRFGLYTLLCFLFLYALHDRLVVPFTRYIAWLSHILLKTLGAQSWVSGASVGIPGFAVEIKNNCNAIYEIGLYAAAVFAYPATLTQRTLGCISGAALLFLVNLLRVLSLIGIGRYFPGGFLIAHLYLWQALFLALVAACWLIWLSRIRRLA